MRIIPKKTKVKTAFFKNVSIPDIVVCVAALAVVALSLSSNLAYNYVIAVTAAVTAVLLMQNMDGIKLYTMIAYGFTFMASRKKFASVKKSRGRSAEKTAKQTVKQSAGIGAKQTAIQTGETPTQQAPKILTENTLKQDTKQIETISKQTEGAPKAGAEKQNQDSKLQDSAMCTSRAEDKAQKKTKPRRGADIEKFFPYRGFSNNRIEYGDYFARVIEIFPMEFRLLSEYKQDRLIDIFSLAFRALGEGQKAQLIKLDRPILFDSFLKKLHRKSRALSDATLKPEEKRARLGIVKDRARVLRAINTTDKVYVSCFYFVIYDANAASCDASCEQAVAALSDGGIRAKALNTQELAVFCKYNYARDFDERSFKNKPAESYAGSIVPESLAFRAGSFFADGVKAQTFAVSEYPLRVANAWGHELFDIPGTRVVMNIGYVDKDKAVRRMDKAVMEIESQAAHGGKASKMIDKETHLQTLGLVLEGLQNDNETLCDVNIYLTLYAGGADKKTVKKIVRNAGFKLNDLYFRQLQGFIGSNLSMRDGINEYELGIHSGSLAAVFPFVSNRILEDNGIVIGENGAPVCVDFFKRDGLHKNSNMVVIGSSGSGKSYAVKTLLANLATENMKVFLYDPENEYGALAKNLGGSTLDVSGGANRINPLHIFQNAGEDDGRLKSPYSEHLQFLESFFKTVFPEIKASALEMINKLAAELYTAASIDEDTDISKVEKFPTLGQLYTLIQERLEKALSTNDSYLIDTMRELELHAGKIAAGGRFSSLWDGPTSIATEENFIVFNFQGLLANKNDVAAQAQMLLITRYLNNEIVKNYNRHRGEKFETMQKFLVVIDEAHMFINKNNPIALQFMRSNAKRVRKYGGMQVVVTQSIQDFVGNADIEYEAKSVINEAQYNMIFPLSVSNLGDLLKLYSGMEINEVEQRDIMDNPRGTAFFIQSTFNRTNIRIVASERTRQLFERREA